MGFSLGVFRFYLVKTDFKTSILILSLSPVLKNFFFFLYKLPTLVFFKLYVKYNEMEKKISFS